ncbi:MAG: 2-dehydropantoate 2-reductase [Thermaerobacter sp.]|nr:2-dehydropantoate 2-reductase [Thermaerobacter sp.]
MRIGVVGVGALGTLFAVKLIAAGHEVVLHVPRETTRELILRRGLVLQRGRSKETARPAAVVADPAQAAPAWLVLFLVKAYATQEAAPAAAKLRAAGGVVLSLQNGLGNLEILQAVVGRARVLGGVTAQGAYLREPGWAVHAGEGPTFVGEAQGPATARVREVAALFTAAALPAQVTDDLEGQLWEKVLLNAGINPLTALLRGRNGMLREGPAAELLALAVAEGAAVARARGVELPHPDPVALARAVVAATARNRSSMLQDLTRGRPTEVEQISGVICREGERLGVPTPVNRVLALMVRAGTRKTGHFF